MSASVGDLQCAVDDAGGGHARVGEHQLQGVRVGPGGHHPGHRVIVGVGGVPAQQLPERCWVEAGQVDHLGQRRGVRPGGGGLLDPVGVHRLLVALGPGGADHQHRPPGVGLGEQGEQPGQPVTHEVQVLHGQHHRQLRVRQPGQLPVDLLRRGQRVIVQGATGGDPPAGDPGVPPAPPRRHGDVDGGSQAGRGRTQHVQQRGHTLHPTLGGALLGQGLPLSIQPLLHLVGGCGAFLPRPQQVPGVRAYLRAPARGSPRRCRRPHPARRSPSTTRTTAPPPPPARTRPHRGRSAYAPAGAPHARPARAACRPAPASSRRRRLRAAGPGAAVHTPPARSATSPSGLRAQHHHPRHRFTGLQPAQPAQQVIDHDLVSLPQQRTLSTGHPGPTSPGPHLSTAVSQAKRTDPTTGGERHTEWPGGTGRCRHRRGR